MTVAAIDIGTNTTNLLIVDGAGTELERLERITRLGAGVAASGRLEQDAIKRTVRQLAEYRQLIDGHGVTAMRAVATSASRDAANREEFFDRAEQVLGIRPQLIAGADEGQLAFRGAVSDLPDDEVHLVMDIGGGSTEFMRGAADLIGVVSIDVGSVRLTENELQHDPPQPEELTNAIGIASDLLDDVERELPGAEQHSTLVGIGGTITTIAAVEVGLSTYSAAKVHGTRLSRAAVEDVFRTLATEPLADRIHNPGLPRERADVIVGGCCVLVAAMRRWHITDVLVSQRSLLDGVCQDLLGKDGGS